MVSVYLTFSGKNKILPANMYGFINTCLKSLVIEKYGEETWDLLRVSEASTSVLPLQHNSTLYKFFAVNVPLRVQTGVQDTFMTYEVYKDEITLQLVEKVCNMLDVSPEAVLRQFGEYFFEFCKKSGYDHMLRTLGGDLYEFIANLDALHSYLSLSYQEMNAPSFRVEMNGDGSMHLHYYSDRRGLCHIVPGIMGAVAMDFFKTEISMEIISQTDEEERTGKKEHVVFLVTQKPAFPTKCPTKPPLVSQGIKNKTFENTYNKYRDRKKQVSVCPVKKNHWATIRGIVHLGRGRMLREFRPVYPKDLWVDVETFCKGLPFHIVFDEELRVKQAGVSIQKIVPGLQTTGIRLDHYFSTVHPEVTLTISSVRKFINSQFVFQTKRHMMPESWRDRPMLELRGQMIWMEKLECMLYLCSPLLRTLHELEERQMHISDIAPHDVTRDLILLNQQRLAEMELSNQLERKKEELRILSKHLEEEKKKTELLLCAMLPKHVANQLKEGKKVEAGEFKECTILFSDVVTFTNICAQCEPIQIVFMLNSMYLRFDRLTTVHDVYKVETIGDAYMVVGGVPVPVSSHAERVANFALGMILMAKQVKNPVNGNPIQIRVGLHSGPVLAGVVGEKMPRYCLFGDTVNTASRMESHGVPNKIHLSPTVYRYLKGKGFEITERGEIDVKGKGRMRTYFLIRNLSAKEKEILGQAIKETDSGRASSQSLNDEASKKNMQRNSPREAQEDDIQENLPIIPMHYSDQVYKPLSLQVWDKERCQEVKELKSKSRSYGSVPSSQHSAEDPLPNAVVSDKDKPQNKTVTSHFCLLL